MISIIGSGRVGSSIAMRIAESGLDDIHLIDVFPDLAKGEALDIGESLKASGSDIDIQGSSDYRNISDSKIVVVTAGFSRKPDETRTDLLKKNFKVVKEVSEKISEHVKDTIIIMVTNPLDVLTYSCLKITNFKRNKVVGMGGMLDSFRFAYFLSRYTNTSIEDINAMVIGEHGDSMVPLYKKANISGIPVTELIEKEKIDDIIEKTRNAGAEVISLKKGTFYAPSTAVYSMIESIIKDKKRIIPSSVYLEGEYNLSDLCIGVPVKLGKSGVEEIVKLNLDDEEKQLLKNSAEHIKKNIEVIENFNKVFNI